MMVDTPKDGAPDPEQSPEPTPSVPAAPAGSRRNLFIIIGVVVLVLVLGSVAFVLLRGHAAENKATESLSKMMRGGEDSLSLSRKEADCTAGELVDNLGLDKLKKYDILKKDNTANKKPSDNVKMSKGDADKAATAITDCIDVVKAVTKSAGKNFSDAQRKCLQRELTKQTMHDMWSAYFRGDSEAASKALLTPVMKCAKA